MQNNIANIELFQQFKPSGILVETDPGTRPLGKQEFDIQRKLPARIPDEIIRDILEKEEDKVLPDSLKTKFNIALEKIRLLPGYVYRGLKGDPDANFHEFLELGKVAYWIGGPTLIACFLAGGKGAVKRSKAIGVGVALYYSAAALSKLVINAPVKWFRGIDLNHPYRDFVDLQVKSPDGFSKRKKEYHKITESIDFTRWDLLYSDNQKNINEKFDKIAQKFGFDEKLNDSDSELKPYIKKLLVESRAWKYAMMVPFVTMAIGIAGQSNKVIKNGKELDEYIWGNLGRSLKVDFRRLFSKSSKFKERLSAIGDILHLKLFKKSFIGLWNGKSGSVFSEYIGKAAVSASILMPIIAVISILRSTSAKNVETVDVSLIQAKPQSQLIRKD